jgi:predicted nucleic acid-binding protein
MGQLAIPNQATVYLDTAVVIYSVEAHPEYWNLLQPLWIKFQSNEISLISSELIWLETLVIPIRNNNSDLIQAYEQLLDEIQRVPVSEAILKEAARLRASTKLKTPDAIHAATSLSLNCTLFLTNDAGFRNISGLPVIVLKDVL